MPKGTPKQLLSDWIQTIEDKNKPIMVYSHAGVAITARANYQSFKKWFSSHKDKLDDKLIYKVFDIPNDSYQVYLVEE